MADIRKQISKSQKKWSQRVNLTSTDNVNNYIEFKILKYGYYNFINNNLWEQYQKNFTDFTEAIFKACKLSVTHNLQTFLRDQGVWVKRNKRVTITQALYNIIHKKD